MLIYVQCDKYDEECLESCYVQKQPVAPKPSPSPVCCDDCTHGDKQCYADCYEKPVAHTYTTEITHTRTRTAKHTQTLTKTRAYNKPTPSQGCSDDCNPKVSLNDTQPQPRLSCPRENLRPHTSIPPSSALRKAVAILSTQLFQGCQKRIAFEAELGMTYLFDATLFGH